MKILEVLALEKDNSNIILHNEGLFLRAYEQSAYLFTSQVKEYNITKKFYKNVKQEVAYLGFPQSSFSKIESICTQQNLSIKQENNQIKITGLTHFTEKEFVNWKNNIPLTESEGVNPRSNSLKENSISEKIRNFPIVSKTPIECQAFIVELQAELNVES